MRFVIQFIFMGGLFWPSFSWPIGHVGTRSVYSEESQFQAYFVNGNISNIRTPRANQVLQVDFLTSQSGLKWEEVRVTLVELPYRLPELSNTNVEVTKNWLLERGFEEQEVQQPCIHYMKKTVEQTHTSILFWGPGKGIHISAQDHPEVNQVISGFIKSMHLKEGACQSSM